MVYRVDIIIAHHKSYVHIIMVYCTVDNFLKVNFHYLKCIHVQKEPF